MPPASFHRSLPVSRASEVQDHGPNLTKEALKAFASLGSDGFYTGNEERDMTRWLKNLWGFDLQTYQVDINLQVACLECRILQKCFLYCSLSKCWMDFTCMVWGRWLPQKASIYSCGSAVAPWSTTLFGTFWGFRFWQHHVGANAKTIPYFLLVTCVWIGTLEKPSHYHYSCLGPASWSEFPWWWMWILQGWWILCLELVQRLFFRWYNTGCVVVPFPHSNYPRATHAESFSVLVFR